MGKTQKFRARENGGRAGKSFLPFFFLFALSQFSGPDYLKAWKRLNWVVPLISLNVREICFKQTSFYWETWEVESRSIGCFLRVPLTFTPFCLRRFFKLECLTLFLIPLPIAFYSNSKSPSKLIIVQSSVCLPNYQSVPWEWIINFKILMIVGMIIVMMIMMMMMIIMMMMMMITTVT